MYSDIAKGEERNFILPRPYLFGEGTDAIMFFFYIFFSIFFFDKCKFFSSKGNWGLTIKAFWWCFYRRPVYQHDTFSIPITPTLSYDAVTVLHLQATAVYRTAIRYCNIFFVVKYNLDMQFQLTKFRIDIVFKIWFNRHGSLLLPLFFPMH